jgi:Zn finger protein HypA/HybF involved in hydrogenase expression
MTEEGFLKAKELFERHFAKELKTIPLPKLTAAAKKRWSQVPEMIRRDIMDNVWCTHCRIGTPMQLREGEMIGRSLVLRGICKKCGSEAARLIEPED